MIDFRKTAPESGAINNLDFEAATLTKTGETELYCTSPRENEVIKLHLYWPGGSRIQQHRYQARTALSLCLNGTDQHSAEQIQEQFDFWGSTVDSDTSLFYNELVLRCTKEFFGESLQWLLKSHVEAVFPDLETENFKQMETASLMRKKTTPRYWANRLCMETIYGEDDVNTRFADPEHIMAMNSGMARDYHQSFLNPRNAKWLLAGDVDAHIQEFTVNAIASLTKVPNSKEIPLETVHSGQAAGLNRKQLENTSQVSMQLARKLPAIGETEYHDFAMLNLLMGGFFGSRLMQEIREKRGLTYGIGSYIQQTTDGNLWVISGEMNSQNAEAALDATLEILRSMVLDPPRGTELERAKRYFAGQLRTSFDGPFAMAGKMRGLFSRGYTLRHYTTAMDRIWSITTEELCQIADNYLNGESFHKVLAGDIS
ncbi:MAG: insulinase family protein [Bacteroidetes bacterium]|nr:insulinase family protein [Bacteroidota bacterium]